MRRVLLLYFTACLYLTSTAQERAISGRVTSTDDGTALPGVNVLVKGTTNGTVTDAEGKFSLMVTGADAVLSFSFIGLSSKEVASG